MNDKRYNMINRRNAVKLGLSPLLLLFAGAKAVAKVEQPRWDIVARAMEVMKEGVKVDPVVYYTSHSGQKVTCYRTNIGKPFSRIWIAKRYYDVDPIEHHVLSYRATKKVIDDIKETEHYAVNDKKFDHKTIYTYYYSGSFVGPERSVCVIWGQPIIKYDSTP